jgi:polyphosphate glucokinase
MIHEDTKAGRAGGKVSSRASAPREKPAHRVPSAKGGPRTLAIDIGGSGLKASVLDEKGNMLTERVRVDTPHPLDPKLLVDTLAALVAPLPAYDRISVGFPGLIRRGKVITAPNLGTEAFAGFDLTKALSSRLKRPVRAVNDADMQGLAAISGKGVELVVTLGTGFGTALFNGGRLQVHLEIAHHPFKKKKTYDEVIGDRGRKKNGKKKWTKDVLEAFDNMRTLVNFDRLYVGGGNARHLGLDLPRDIVIVDNSAGILGGIKLWDDLLEDV